MLLVNPALDLRRFSFSGTRSPTASPVAASPESLPAVDKVDEDNAPLLLLLLFVLVDDTDVICDDDEDDDGGGDGFDEISSESTRRKRTKIPL